MMQPHILMDLRPGGSSLNRVLFPCLFIPYHFWKTEKAMELSLCSYLPICLRDDGSALSYNPGQQHPHLHGPVHTPDNNRWDAPPV